MTTPLQKFFISEFSAQKALGLSDSDAALTAVEKYYPAVDDNLRPIEDQVELKQINIRKAEQELSNTEVQDEILKYTKGQWLSIKWIQKEHLKEYIDPESSPKTRLWHLTKLWDSVWAYKAGEVQETKVLNITNIINYLDSKWINRNNLIEE